MARTVKILLVCDLDENEDDVETVTFSLNGRAYVMELCGDHRGPFLAMMHEYVSLARREGGSRRPPAARLQPPDEEQEIAAVQEVAAVPE